MHRAVDNGVIKGILKPITEVISFPEPLVFFLAQAPRPGQRLTLYRESRFKLDRRSRSPVSLVETCRPSIPLLKLSSCIARNQKVARHIYSHDITGSESPTSWLLPFPCTSQALFFPLRSLLFLPINVQRFIQRYNSRRDIHYRG